ncbi:DoxX family protein [Halobacillus kuroshimensis]|uniref:DoxX family protein n=1 Tax=Halobacillus kuroshimensis TaxID=302481 RepID=A0ABS3DSC8_9BACI|nr:MULTISPECIES: DoxX family protein [Halobacillus]MBN8234235.1 DoxX family protein [Halobacillus kuroshimensis]
MLNNFLRTNKIAAAVLAVIRVYIGVTWLKAGIGKLTGGFEVQGFLQGAISQAAGEHPAVQGWWAAFLEGFALPNHTLFAQLVMWGEILAGIALILGLFTTAAAFGGILMNFAFLFSGTVSTNPQMVILTVFILAAGINAGRYGLDHWIVPFMQKRLPHIRKGQLAHT